MSNPTTSPRHYQGIAILSYGFRPFFLFAGLWALVAMPLWVIMLAGGEPLPIAMGPVDWHVHEFLFGYLGAVIAGFILTAVPNWTRRLPITGWRLGLLAGLWLTGRIAVALSDLLPGLLVAVLDVAFLVILSLAILREIMVGKNWRNLPVFAMIALLGLANALFHCDVATSGSGSTGYGARLGIALVVMLISLIGGRIVPSFTRNWLVKNKSDAALPQPLNRADGVILVASALGLGLWLVWPDAASSGLLLVLLGIAHLWRLSRWQGGQSRSEPLLWVLHIGYLFIPVGYLLIGGAILWPDVIPQSSAKHAWLVGAFGIMTLAVMTRATLGHTGHALSAGAGTLCLYLAILLAGVLRLLAGYWPGEIALLHASATAWILAYGLFILLYAPLLLRPKGAPKRPSGSARE